MIFKKNINWALLLIVPFIFSSCATKEVSSVTGWEYNSDKWGGYEKINYLGQETGPGLVLIQGGSYVMAVEFMKKMGSTFQRRVAA